MAYNENIPQESDNPSQSQPQLLSNFKEISTAFNANHGNFNAPDQGKHSFLQMPEQSSVPATSSNEAALFSQESSLTLNTELVFRRESNGDQIEFTGFLGSNDGWTRLPSGILLKWGTGSGTGINTTIFPTGATIPIFSAVYSAQVTGEDTSSTPNTYVTFRTISTTEIIVNCTKRTSTPDTSATYRYLVIGL